MAEEKERRARHHDQHRGRRGRALAPLIRTFPRSGPIAQGLFALGIVSLGMLAIPVMAGSTSYALSEARGPEGGLGPHAAGRPVLL